MQDDDSLGSYFRDVKAIKQQRREENRERGAELLSRHNIEFITKNGGAHLIVTHNGRTADYWPGTGKFIFRDKGKGRGIFNLLRALGIEGALCPCLPKNGLNLIAPQTPPYT